MRTARFRDDPWQRLPWLVPGALIGASIALMGFMRLLTEVPIGQPLPRPIDVQVVELPVPAEAIPAPPSPPQPVEELAPPEQPPPPPVVKEEPPPPEAKPEFKPEPVISSPPKRQLPPRRLAPPKPETVAPEPRSARQEAVPDPQPIARAPAAPATPGGNLGARAIYKPMPELPDELRRRNLDAIAVARFRVAANGTAQVDFLEPTNDPRLNRLLIDTLKTWRFFPALENGKPVESIIDIRVPISVR